MRKFSLGILCLAVAGMAAGLTLVSSGVVRAEISAPPEIGKPVPDFTLSDYEGKEHSLAANKGKIVVVSFTSLHCPYSKGAEPAYARMAEAFADKGVVFFSIDSHKATSAADLAKYATADNKTGKKLPYPILKDVDNKYADALGAKQTPEIYIADKDGKLAYHGAIDNMKSVTDPAYKNYAAAALDDLLAGKPVSEPNHKAYGCSIARKVS